MMKPGLALGIALGLLALCAAAADIDWRAPLLREHPLVGRIWDVSAGREVSRAEMLARLSRSKIVLLGETHDNEDHHRLQAEIYSALSAGNARPALVMEQFDSERQSQLDAARHAPAATVADLARGGGFNRHGWNLDFYAPLLERALAIGAPVVAANLSRDAARAVVREGFSALGRGRAGRLALAEAWAPDVEATIKREMVAGHCGQVAEPLLSGLAAAQRARDALMADALLDHAQQGAVGIIGRGHARRDIGVPRYLAQRRPALNLVTVGLVEAESGLPRVAEYVAAYPGFDYLWFTPRAQRRDPCEGFSMPQAR